MGKHQALSQRRVRVHPKSDERRRIGIGQIDFAKRLERVSGHLRRVRDYAVNQLQAEDIGVVFLHAAVCVSNRFANEAEHQYD